MNKKTGILAVLGTVLVAILFMATVTGAGYMKQTTLFEDDFDGVTDVDWTKWKTEGNESWFDIKYDSLRVSWDSFYAGDEANWSYGIHTKYGYANDTIYGTQDIYLIPMGFDNGKVWVGFVDQYYVNDTGMLQEYAGLCGVYFLDNHTTECGFWWVDNTGTYQEETSIVTLFWSHWYTSYIIYDSVNNTGIVNLTDNNNGMSEEYEITHIKPLKDDVKTFTVGNSYPLTFGKGVQPFAPPHIVFPIYYMDNVRMWTYDWVTTPTPPTPPVVPIYNEIYGLWLGIFFAMWTIGSLIFYGNIRDYLSSRGYLNAQYWAFVPCAVGLIGLGLATGLYYGYFGDVTYAPSWKWW